MIEQLVGQFEAVTAMVMRNLDDVDHEASLRSTPATGKPIYWVLGHLCTSYNRLLPVLGRDRVVDDETLGPFRSGSTPLSAEEAPMEFTKLVELFQTASARFVDALRHLPEERHQENAPFSPRQKADETLISLLYLIAFHQAYHCGQLAILRHACGLGPRS